MNRVEELQAKLRALQPEYDAARAVDLHAQKIKAFDRIDQITKVIASPDMSVLAYGRVLEALEAVRAVQRTIASYDSMDKEYKRLVKSSIVVDDDTRPL